MIRVTKESLSGPMVAQTPLPEIICYDDMESNLCNSCTICHKCPAVCTCNPIITTCSNCNRERHSIARYEIDR